MQEGIVLFILGFREPNFYVIRSVCIMINKQEIQNILRSEGVMVFDANKTIFGIAALGLIVGKEKLDLIVHDFYAMEERKHFHNDIILTSASNDYKKSEIVHLSLELISKMINGKVLARITEIILQNDLLDIVLHMNVFDYDMGIRESPIGGQPISGISWINNLVVEILKLHGGKNLLNVDCGTGEFVQQMLEIGGIESATGYTFTNLTCTIAKIRNYFASEQVNISLEKIFFTIAEEKFDMVYNSYPLMRKYDKEELLPMIESWKIPIRLNKKYSANLLWIINALEYVKQDGIVVAFVANGVLFNDIDTDLRKYLVENNIINSIISLPTGILPFSNVATSLIVLKKNNRNTNTIRMVDATKICQKQRRYSTFSEENIETIVNLYKDFEKSEMAFNVSYEDIVKNNYNLGIDRYIEAGFTLINPWALEDVTRSIFRGYQIKATEFDEMVASDCENTEYRIINVSDVKTNGLVETDLQPISIEDTRKFSKYCVEDGDIIITAKNSIIKSAIYREQNGYKAVLTGNLIAIRVNEKKINPYYLKAFLDSEIGIAALNSIRTGTTVYTITTNNLKKMMVSVPNKEIQDSIAIDYKNALCDIEDLEKKYIQKIEYLKQIYNLK